jgi:cell division protease FtsH
MMNAKEKRIVAYHESGHALVAMTVPTADPVNKISIIPRGIAALGYTQQLPTEDRYLMTQEELVDRLCVLLGGRVAEEIIFQDVSTGAQNDLQRATDIARSMVTEYGMSEKLGLVTYTKEKRPLFLDTGLAPSKEYSEETAREIDHEVSQLMSQAHDRVRGILTEKREQLETISQTLMEKETLLADELYGLLHGKEAEDQESAAVKS